MYRQNGAYIVLKIGEMMNKLASFFDLKKISFSHVSWCCQRKTCEN